MIGSDERPLLDPKAVIGEGSLITFILDIFRYKCNTLSLPWVQAKKNNEENS